MKSTRVYNFSIPAGGSFQLPVTGSYFRVMTATDVLEVQGDTFGNIYPLYTGQGLQGQEFRSLNLLNRTGATNNGSILVSDGKFVDDRITGDVSIIDGGKNRTIANNSFTVVNYVAGVAAKGPSIQLHNLVGNSKRLIVNTMGISSTAAQGLNCGISSNILTITGATGQSKLSNGFASTSRTYSDNLVANPINVYGLLIFNIVANVSYEKKFIEPIVLNPGYGLTLYSGGTGLDLSAYFEYFEESIL